MDSNQNPSSGAPVAATQGSVDAIRKVWLVLLASRWVVINTSAICIIAGILYSFRSTPLYEATGNILINPEGGGLLAGNSVINLLGRDTEYLQTQYRVLQSRTILERVVSKLRLDEDLRYKGAPDRVQALARDLRFTPVRLTRLVSVSCLHPEPARAKEIVNSLMEAFIADHQSQKSFTAIEAYRQLRQEVQSQENELKGIMQAMQQYRIEKQASSLDERANTVYAMAVRSRELAEQRRITAEEAMRLALEADAWQSQGRRLSDFPGVAADAEVARAKLALSEHESQFASITNRYGPKHPAYRAMAASIASDARRLETETSRSFRALKARADLEKYNHEAAVKIANEKELEVGKLNELRINYEMLNSRKLRIEMMYQTMLSRAKEFEMGGKEIAQNVRVVDAAVTPILPAKPRKPLIIAGSAVAGLVAGLGLALFLSYLNDSVKSVEDVESFLGCRFLGFVAHIEAKSPVERDVLAAMQPTSAVAEMFRSLRATIQLGPDGERLRTICVTSTLSGEGKSLVASNLSIVMAQAGLRVLLVDSDLRRPSVHQAFDKSNKVGLSSWLRGQVDSAEAIVQKTSIANLDLVCSGPIPKNPSELLASERLSRFLELSQEKYDRILMDCPPVSAVSDPLIVGSRCDGVLLVTRFNKIRREHVRRVVQKLTNAGIRILGLAINDLSFETSDAYYYAYERYGYYSAYHKTGKAKEAARPPAGKVSSEDVGKAGPGPGA